MQKASIIEVGPNMTDVDVINHVLSDSCVGLLVVGDNTDLDCRQVIDKLPVSCAGIAFVSGVPLRLKRKMAVNLGLSRHHSCPCRVFNDREQAQQWLQQQVHAN